MSDALDFITMMSDDGAFECFAEDDVLKKEEGGVRLSDAEQTNKNIDTVVAKPWFWDHMELEWTPHLKSSRSGRLLTQFTQRPHTLPAEDMMRGAGNKTQGGRGYAGTHVACSWFWDGYAWLNFQGKAAPTPVTQLVCKSDEMKTGF